MDILTLSKKSRIEIIKEYILLFNSFDSVYIFGSVLNDSIIPNDIDILLIYKKYSNKISGDLKLISNELEKVSGLVVDLTVLSFEEEADIAFLARIKDKCVQIK